MNPREFFSDLVKAYGSEGSPLRVEMTTDKDDPEILIYGPIVDLPWFEDEISALRVKKLVDQVTGSRLNVRINSPGGFLDEGIAIMNVLRAAEPEVHVYVDGVAASSASIAAMGGDVVHMPVNATMFIHEPWTWAAGNADYFDALADDLRQATTRVVDSYLMKAPNADRAELERLVKAETSLSAQEAVDLGLADIVDGQDVPVAAFAWNYANFAYGKPPTQHQSNPSRMPSASVQPPAKEQSTMDPVEITLDWLRENRMDLVNLIEAAAPVSDARADELRAEGAVGERQRIRDIEENSLPGHDALVRAAIEDGETTGPELAAQIVKAEKATRARIKDELDDATPEPLEDDDPPTDDSATDYESIEDVNDRIEAMWDGNATWDGDAVRDAYASKEHFAALYRATAEGRVRVLRK